MEKFVFFPLDDGGIDLHRQVCVDVCPASSTATVVTYLKPEERRLGSLVDAIPVGISETNSLLRAPAVTATMAPSTPAPAAPATVSQPEAPAEAEQPLAVQSPAISVSPFTGGFQGSLSVATPALPPPPPPPATPVLQDVPESQEIVVRGYPSFLWQEFFACQTFVNLRETSLSSLGKT